MFAIGKVRGKTWRYWLEGINANLKRPAFYKAWRDISDRAPDDFSELRRFLRSAKPALTNAATQQRALQSASG